MEVGGEFPYGVEIPVMLTQSWIPPVGTTATVPMLTAGPPGRTDGTTPRAVELSTYPFMYAWITSGPTGAWAYSTGPPPRVPWTGQKPVAREQTWIAPRTPSSGSPFVESTSVTWTSVMR